MTKITTSSMFRAVSRPDPQNLRLLRKAASRYAASISGDGYVVRIRPRTIRFVRTSVCYVVVQGPDGVDIPYKSADGYSWNTTHLEFENTGAYAQDHKKVIDKVLEVAKEFHRRQNHTQD